MRVFSGRLPALLAAVVMVMSLAVTACGGREDESENTQTETAQGTSSGPVDTSNCPPGGSTQGVTEDKITFGTSLPLSGPLAAIGAEYDGERAALDLINNEGGVNGRELEIIAKDDQFQPSRTVSNVNSLLADEKVFGIVGLVGTPGNLAVVERFDEQCVPNLLVVTGNAQVAGHPWTTLAQQSNAIEPHILLDGISEEVPEPKLGLLTQNDDLGNAFVASWEKAVSDGGGTIAARETYEPTDTTLTSQVTSIAGEGANVIYFGGSGGPLCAQLLDAAAGKFEAVVLTGGCAVKPLLGLAKSRSQENVYTMVAYKDPTDPKNQDDPEVQAFLEQMEEFPKADVSSAITLQGYTIGMVLGEILKSVEEVDRGSVINAAKTIELDSPGMLADGITWKVSEDDPYPVESFEFVKWNPQTKLFDAQGDVNTEYEGRSTELGE